MKGPSSHAITTIFLLLRLYPGLQFGYEVGNIFLTLTYALDLIRYHSIPSWLSGITVSYADEPFSNQLSANGGVSISQRLFNTVTMGLEAGAFVMQFLAW